MCVLKGNRELTEACSIPQLCNSGMLLLDAVGVPVRRCADVQPEYQGPMWLDSVRNSVDLSASQTRQTWADGASIEFFLDTVHGPCHSAICLLGG